MAKKKQPSDRKQRVELWSSRYNSALSNQTKLFKRYSRWYDLFYGYLIGELAQWRSKIVDPNVSNKIWAMVSKIIPNEYGYFVRGRRPEFVEPATFMRDALARFNDNPDLDESIWQKKVTAVIDAAVTGQSPVKIPWKTMTKTFRGRPIDERTGLIDNSKVEVTELTVQYPDIEPWDPFHYFFDKEATSFQSSKWHIFEHFVTLGELKAENKRMPDGISKWVNLDKIRDEDDASDDVSTYEQSRSRLLDNIGQGEPLNTGVNKIRIWECYDKDADEIFWVANKSVMVREPMKLSFYDHGRYPAEMFYLRKRPHSILGIGLFEMNERLIHANNDVVNHFMDNWNLSVNGMLLTNSDTIIEDYTIEPGGEIIWTGPSKPEQFKIPEPNPQTFSLVRQVIRQSLEEGTISNYSTGTPSSDSDQTRGTATGITRLQQAANDLVGLMRKSFRDGEKRVQWQWMKNIQQFLDVPLWVFRNNKPVEIKPEYLLGDFELVIDDREDLFDKTFDRNSTIAFLQQLSQVVDKSIQITQLKAQGIDLPLEPNFDQWVNDLGKSFSRPNISNYVVNSGMVNDTPDNENIILLEGRNVVVSPQEDHEKHIDVHNEALQIAKTRETQDRIIEHMAEHDKFIIQQQQLEAQNAARQAVDNISGRASDILKGAIERRTAEAQMAGGGEVGQEVPRAQGFGGIPTIGADIAPEGAVGFNQPKF